MDGVIRHWHAEPTLQAERELGMPPGSLIGVLMSVPEYEQAMVGQVSFDVWTDAVEHRLAANYDAASAHAVVSGWRAYRGDLDREMVELVAAVREVVPVALLSNAHDQLPRDLVDLGLGDAFDVVVCSALVGLAKPDPRIYEYAAAQFGVAPSECFFTDDLEPNVSAARALGIDAVVFMGPGALRAELSALGLVRAE